MGDDTFHDALDKDGRNLVERAGELEAVDFRDDEIAAVLAELDKGRSVLLVGPSGVGKTLVIHGVARAMAERGRGAVVETSTALMLAGTRYIGEWQTKVTRLATLAAERSACLYVTDAHNLMNVGRTVQSQATMLDALRPFLESGRLKLVAEATPEVQRAMQKQPAFVALFRTFEIAPLSEAKVDAALERLAAARGARLDAASRRALIHVTSRFSPARPQPGPALGLLREAIDYQEQKRGIGEDEPLSPAFVERVFSITSGLPAFVVSRSVSMPAGQIRDWFADRIIGQGAAIDAVVETIALFKSGLHDASRPIGTFLFVGPTGVGKTEVARALATFLFGSPQRLLRFDLSEFKDYSSFELLLGDPAHPDKPARLLDPVRAQPFQVVLFDELEKAHSNMWDLLLPLLDEGRMTTPGGETVDFRSTILIATSNVGADAGRAQVGFGSSQEPSADGGRIQRALEAAFRPELLNRFQHTIAFHRLSLAELRHIARQEVARVLRREGIVAQGLVVDVPDEALDRVIEEGLDVRFGARALKREVQRRIVLPIAMTLMEEHVAPGSILRVVVKDGHLRVRVVATAESRAHARERAPVRSPGGQVVTRADLAARTSAVRAALQELADRLAEPELVAARARLVKNRSRSSYWKDTARSAAEQRELDRAEATLDRLARTRERVDELEAALAEARDRATLDAAALRARAAEDALADARRELVSIGWEGSWDALVEIRPVGGTGRQARDLLVETYRAWAELRRFHADWLREPRDADEAALLAIKGLYAYGWLRLESGLHRLRLAPPAGSEGERGKLVVAGVRVVAWVEGHRNVTLASQRPLKATGQYGGKIRSRAEVEGLVLQSHRTLGEQRELAADLVGAWQLAPAWSDEVVRRYDREPPRVRDALTGHTSGRADALAPRNFDTLLRSRVDASAAGPAPGPG